MNPPVTNMIFCVYILDFYLKIKWLFVRIILFISGFIYTLLYFYLKICTNQPLLCTSRKLPRQKDVISIVMLRFIVYLSNAFQMSCAQYNLVKFFCSLDDRRVIFIEMREQYNYLYTFI